MVERWREIEIAGTRRAKSRTEMAGERLGCDDGGRERELKRTRKPEPASERRGKGDMCRREN